MASPALEEDPRNVENLMWINASAALSTPAASDFLMTPQLTGLVWNMNPLAVRQSAFHNLEKNFKLTSRWDPILQQNAMPTRIRKLHRYQNFSRVDADRSPTAGLKLAEACQCLSEVPRHEYTRKRLGKGGTTIHFLAE